MRSTSANLKPIEAQALLSGIVLDTKNFSIRTSPRTFESAAYLRKAGADPVEVKKLFQTDLDDTLLRYRVIQAARLYRNEIAIACVDEKLTRVIASQAADELINVSGITTSFVLFPDDGQIIISARSIGSCNVQAVLETLGNGGGNGATAGAQIKGKPLQEVLKELIAANRRILFLISHQFIPPTRSEGFFQLRLHIFPPGAETTSVTSKRRFSL